MKLKIFCFLCAAFILLTGCAGESSSDNDKSHVVATSYPVYIFAMNVIGDTQGIELDLLVDQQISCIHDYTLSVKDMLLLENADLLLMNGADLEHFLEDALKTYPNLPTADCSAGVELLTFEDGETDPHIWLDPRNAVIMTENLTDALIDAYPEHTDVFQKNCAAYTARLSSLFDELHGEIRDFAPHIVTFHDGFAYFAEAFDITILHSIEEEAGSEASAAEINEIVNIIKAESSTVIFTEINGSDSTAKAIAVETGAPIGVLDTAVSGEKTASGYEDIMRSNISAVKNAVTAVNLRS